MAKRTLRIDMEGIDDYAYERIANAVWFVVNAVVVGDDEDFEVLPDARARVRGLNREWSEQDRWQRY